MIKQFHNLEHVDWTKVGLVMASVIAVWTGLQNLIPQYFHGVVLTILAALQCGITVMMRGNKFVEREDGSGVFPPKK